MNPMKIIQLLFLFLVLQSFTNEIEAQNYLDESSKWYTLAGDTYDKWYWISKFQIIGDSTINDTTYHKIHREFDRLRLDFNGSGDTIEYYTGWEQILLLREEDKKFYTRSGDADHFIIDFDLELGSIIVEDLTEHEITNIDSILIGNEYRKIFEIDNFKRVYEGIGTSLGLFEGLGWLGSHPAYAMLCYQQGGINYELHTGWIPGFLTLESCDSLTFNEIITNTQIIEDQEFILYPNPFKTSVNINLNQFALDKIDILILDINGKILFQDHRNILNDTIRIDLSTLSQGMYFIQIKANKNSFHSKIIKI